MAGGGVGVSLEEMFASGGGSLPTFPTSSTSGVQTLEKLLSALPPSQIVFNSPIKEVNCLIIVIHKLKAKPSRTVGRPSKAE